MRVPLGLELGERQEKVLLCGCLGAVGVEALEFRLYKLCTSLLALRTSEVVDSTCDMQVLLALLLQRGRVSQKVRNGVYHRDQTPTGCGGLFDMKDV